MTDLAILGGGGILPVALARACPDARRIAMAGVAQQMPEPVVQHSFERFGALFEDLHEHGVKRIVFAGALSRPQIDPGKLDPVSAAFAPRLVAAMQGGDDGLLRTVIAFFEENGIAVVGAHDLLPDIVVPKGLLSGPEPDVAALADTEAATTILRTMSVLDVGQGAVVAGGLCLGIETLQGTDAMLRFVAQTDAARRPRARGVLVKRPKDGQDLRVDMPAIGPETVRLAAQAGLAGIVAEAGKVLLLDRAGVVDALQDSGLFLVGRAL